MNAAVLKSAREYYHLIQINNLQHKVLHRFGVFWAGLAAKCATECATAGILCNSTARGVEPIDPTALRFGIRRSMLRPYTNLTSTNIESLLFFRPTQMPQRTTLSGAPTTVRTESSCPKPLACRSTRYHLFHLGAKVKTTDMPHLPRCFSPGNFSQARLQHSFRAVRASRNSLRQQNFGTR